MSPANLTLAIPSLLEHCPAVHRFVERCAEETDLSLDLKPCASESKLTSCITSETSLAGLGCGSYQISSINQHPVHTLDLHVVYSGQGEFEHPWTQAVREHSLISLPDETYFPRLNQAIWESLQNSVRTSQIVHGYSRIRDLLANAKSGAFCPFVYPVEAEETSTIRSAPITVGKGLALKLLWKHEREHEDLQKLIRFVMEPERGSVLGEPV